MKFFRVLLRKTADRTIQYPTNYQEEIGNYATEHLYYDDGGVSYLLLSIEDKDAVGVVRTDVEEVTAAQARTISEANEHPTITCSNEAMVQYVQLKVLQGLALTQDEQDAIDPDNPKPGFKRVKRFIDKVEGT